MKLKDKAKEIRRVNPRTQELAGRGKGIEVLEVGEVIHLVTKTMKVIIISYNAHTASVHTMCKWNSPGM